VAKRPTNGSKGAIRLEASQLLISQRIAQAAVRRANAIEGWLADGIATQDLCGNTFLAPSFGPGVALGEGGTATPTFADPRPIPSAASRRKGGASAVKLEAAQLLINQRISQAAVRRVNALAARLEAGLSGGDIRDGAITAEKLRKGLTVTSAASAGDPVPPSRTILKGRSGGGDRVTVSVRQLQINQRISQAAVRRVNALQDRLMAGLTAADFREGSIGAAKLAPELRGAGAQ
jgi:hypothetical protein